MSSRDPSVSFGVCIFCNASIVDDGGVFSPKMGFSGGLVGFKVGVSRSLPLPLDGDVPDLVGLFSGERFSKSSVKGLENLSGDLSGDLSRELKTSV